MEDIAGSAVAGLITAVVATIILGVAKWVYQKHLQRLAVKQIQEVLTDGRRRVLEAKETFNHNMDATLPGDMLRAAQYNLMIKQLRIALDHTTSNLSYAKRKRRGSVNKCVNRHQAAFSWVTGLTGTPLTYWAPW